MVVDALRAAGYLPVPADEHEVVDLRRVLMSPGRPVRAHSAAGSADRPLDRFVPVRPAPEGEPDAADRLLLEMATRLSAGADEGGPGTEVHEQLEVFAPQLTPPGRAAGRWLTRS